MHTFLRMMLEGDELRKIYNPGFGRVVQSPANVQLSSSGTPLQSAAAGNNGLV